MVPVTTNFGSLAHETARANTANSIKNFFISEDFFSI
jgi:hypothetical protein